VRQTTGQITRLGTLKTLLQRFAFLSLIALTFALMLIGKADTVLVERARIAITDAVVPILRVLSEPANAIAETIANVRELAAIREQNSSLRDANERLLQWQSITKNWHYKWNLMETILIYFLTNHWELIVFLCWMETKYVHDRKILLI